MSFPGLLTITVTLAGVDVTSYVSPGSFSVNNILTKQVDTCSLTLEDAAAVDPQDWQELVVLDGATRLFAGYVTDIDREDGPDLGVDFKLTASDYSIRLDKVLIKEEKVGMTDAEILAELFDEYLRGEGYDASTHVQTIKTYERKRFNRFTLLECVQDLAALAKADYYIDPDKNLHFFETSTRTTAAPFTLSDNPDKVASMPYFDLTINLDGAGVVNRVEILGGNYRSDDTTFYLAGTGKDNRIILPFKLHAPTGYSSIQIWRNYGTAGTPSWTALTVKVGYLDQLTGTNEILYYFSEKVIEQQSNWPALANAVKIIAKYEVPLRTRVTDQASVDHYGMFFDDVIIDDTITEKPVARLAGLALLAANAAAKEAITLKCDHPGLRAGMVVTLVSSLHGLNGNYLIQKVQAKIGINGRVRNSISLGTYNPDLIDLMLLLARLSKPRPIWRDDEVLDELLQKTETITLTETTANSATSGPYYFSEDPLVAFIWGFGAFQP